MYPNSTGTDADEPINRRAMGLALVQVGDRLGRHDLVEMGKKLLDEDDPTESRVAEIPKELVAEGNHKDQGIKTTGCSTSPVEKGLEQIIAIFIPLAIVLPMLLWALLPDNPYSYYRLLRWVCCPCFLYLAVAAYQRNLDGWVWFFSVIALIYNPIVPVHLNRGLWSLINVASVVIAIAGTWTLWRSAKPRQIPVEGASL